MTLFLRTFISVLCVLALTSSAAAWDDSDEPYNKDGNPNYRYEGMSGKKYQYDLSDPSDRLEYQMDLDAQMRDKLNVDPSIDLDRDLGQRGGGAKDQ